MGRGTEIAPETVAALCQQAITHKQPEYEDAPCASLLVISSSEELISSRETGI